jgi:hypothetical protein
MQLFVEVPVVADATKKSEAPGFFQAQKWPCYPGGPASPLLKLSFHHRQTIGRH